MKLSMGVLISVTATAIASTLFLWRTLIDERALVAQQANEIGLLRSVSRVPEALPPKGASETMPGMQTPSTLARTVPVPPPSANPTSSSESSARTSQADRKVTPKREVQRQSAGVLYRKLIEQLDLTPDQAEELKDRIADLQLRLEDILHGPDNSRAAIVAATTSAKLKSDEELQSLLGTEKFQAYEEYSRTVFERNQVEVLRQRLAAAREPMSDDQADRLLQAMLEEKSNVWGSGEIKRYEGTSEERAKKQTDYEERVRIRAASVLNDVQLNQFGGMLQAYSYLQSTPGR